ncbi:hypothetical protein RB599_006130 [Gaeumannomyces hyphopodioides]
MATIRTERAVAPLQPKDAAAMHDPATTPWELVNNAIALRSSDAQFWWQRAGRIFARLLEAAHYAPDKQIAELTFFALFVAPELGPAPDPSTGEVARWKSPATPDCTPMDFSWEWSARGTVRYAFEPIGPQAGTSADPLNRHATDLWIKKLQAYGLVPGLDTSWYDHFARQVLPQDDIVRTKTADGFIEETTPLAGCFVARDLEPTGPVVKVYVYPGLKAAELGLTNLEMVSQAIRSLPQYSSLNAEPLLEFLAEGTEKYGFETGIVGIDCKAPDEGARIKIYVRAPHTSTAYLMDCLTLGGRLPPGPGSEGAVQDLLAFWDAFLGEAPDVLPADLPGRASPGFYYTVGCGRPVAPKLYISPLTFCKSDADFLARLRGYFSSRSTDQAAVIDDYEKAAQDIYGRHTLEERCDGHYYVGCALHKNKLRVVSYMAPQIIWREKEAMRAS